MEQETRTCRYCNEPKLLQDFEIANIVNGKEYRRHKCKTCYGKRKLARRRELQSWLQNYKQKLSCERCGNDDYRVLDFHHRDPKTKEHEVGTSIGRWGPARIEREIKKCQVFCSNCHRIVHWEWRQSKDKT